MTTETALYLAIVIVTFVLFAWVPAYQSRRQSRRGPDVVSAREDHRDTHGTVSA